jgi:ornithine cyclodeaminase/alanine dehydrogenase-like protein (mu-crystallin family)
VTGDGKHAIKLTYLSQEDLLRAECLDFDLAIESAERALLAFRAGDVMFPEKIVQIFDQTTQERINCLPATLLNEKVCGVKWVSVFPPNVTRFGLQNLTALFVLSEIERGFPIAVLEGTLASNMRVGAMGALAAKHFAAADAESIGFIGAGEQAKMHLLAMKTVRPSLRECRIAALTGGEEDDFIAELSPLLPDVEFVPSGANAEKAMRGADILVTATSAQAPLLQAAWMKPGSFYSHVGGWEDDYAVAQQADTIVCDDWETVKHRTQTLSRMYQDGLLTDGDIHANLDEVVAGQKAGRQAEDERVYFNAVGLSFVDVAIALAMYHRALDAGRGTELTMQETTVFEHPDIVNHVRL